MSHSHLLKLAIAGALAVAILVLLMRLERRGKGLVVAQIAMTVVVLDAALYPSTTATELVGFFHPSFGGQNFRLTQVVITLALLAKALTKGLPRRLDATSGWWLAFFLWYATAAVVGVADGNDSHLVVSRAYFVIEAGGMAVLVAAVPMREWLGDHGLVRLLRISGVVAGVVFVMSKAGVSYSGQLPYFPLQDFGSVGPDAATIFLSLGLIGLAMELTRQRRRRGVLLASVVLVVAHTASQQRATRLDLAVSVFVFLLIVLVPRRRRFAVRGGELAIVALAVVGLVAAPVFVKAVTGTETTSVVSEVPIVNSATQVASTDYRQGSVQSRYNEWAVAAPLIPKSPITGYGLGKTFNHYDIGTRAFITYDITNNIGLDLLVRTGIAGLLLFVLALASTTKGAWRAWRYSVSDEAALVSAMTLAVLAGLLAKGMVESILNEYHMTPLFGFLIGLLITAAADAGRRGAEVPAQTPEPLPAPRPPLATVGS